jgi:hypothetical protein
MLPDTSQDPKVFKLEVTDQESDLTSAKDKNFKIHDPISISEHNVSQMSIADTPRTMTCGEIYRTQFPFTQIQTNCRLIMSEVNSTDSIMISRNKRRNQRRRERRKVKKQILLAEQHCEEERQAMMVPTEKRAKLVYMTPTTGNINPIPSIRLLDFVFPLDSSF